MKNLGVHHDNRAEFLAEAYSKKAQEGPSCALKCMAILKSASIFRLTRVSYDPQRGEIGTIQHDKGLEPLDAGAGL